MPETKDKSKVHKLSIKGLSQLDVFYEDPKLKTSQDRPSSCPNSCVPLLPAFEALGLTWCSSNTLSILSCESQRGA